MDTAKRLTDLENTVKMVTSLLDSTTAELEATKAELARVAGQVSTLESDYSNHGHWTQSNDWTPRLTDRRRNHTVST